MSFGRWLLVHSFSIFLVTLFIFGYIYRSELQLEIAYQQLLNIDPENDKTLSATDIPVQISTESENASTDDKHLTVSNTPDIQADKIPAQPAAPSLATLPTVPTVPVVSDKLEPAKSPRADERLFLARQAYWDKNYADAIYYYRQLIQENSNNPDYLGELGNIYYSLNDNQNASSLYYQAALLFINQNQPDRARLLIAPVIAMNRDLGEKLRYKLQ